VLSKEEIEKGFDGCGEIEGESSQNLLRTMRVDDDDDKKT
jgi:hypothetical protein